jgi:PAS domain S-box-containing protein
MSQLELTSSHSTEAVSMSRLFQVGLKRVRQQLKRHASLREILDTIIDTIEEQFPGMIGSILLLQGNELHHGSAAGLPEGYCNAINGLVIGFGVGSCGTAAHTGEQVIVENIETHPYWEPFKQYALEAGVKACWSQPIFSSSGEVLGTFALYYRDPKAPEPSAIALLEAAAEIAGIAIEMKRDETNLSNSEEQFTVLANSIPQLAWMAEPDGWVFWYNQRWYEYTGTTLEEMQGWGWSAVHHPQSRDQVVEFIKDAWQKGEPWELSFPLRRHDGQYRWFLTRSYPIKNTEGEIVRWIGTNTDITEQRKAEERFRVMADASPHFIWELSPDGQAQYVNKAALDYVGKTFEEYTATPWSIYLHPEELDAVASTIMDAVAARKGYRIEHRIKGANGQYRWFVSSADPSFLADGELYRYIGSAIDIHEVKEAEQALAWSNKMLGMVAHAQNLFFSNENIYDMFEKPLLDLLDLTESEYGFIGEILQSEAGQPYLKCCFLTNIGWNQETRDLWENNRKTGFEFHKLDNLFGRVITTGEVVIANEPDQDPRRSMTGRPDGHPPLSSFMGIPFYKNRKLVGMVGIANRPEGYAADLIERLKPFLDACANIIEAYRSQQEKDQLTRVLSESETRFRSLADTAPVAIFMAGEDAQVTYWNKYWLNYTGQTFEESLCTSWADAVHPDDYERTLQTFTDSYQNRTVYELENRLKGKDGQYRWFFSKGCPRYLPNEEFAGFIGTILDITERKRQEEEIRQLNDELECRVEARTNQLSAVNRELESFSYSVSHDLRAPLRSINGFSQALMEDYGEHIDALGQDFLQRICKESQRMGQLIDDILALSRLTRGEVNKVPVNLSNMAQEIMNTIRGQEPGRIEVQVIIQPNMLAQADEHLIYAVLQNLLDNAWKFTSQREAARIEFGMKEIDGVPSYFVKDNGAGFNMAYVGKLFGAFQRLHAMDEFSGSGIGLATVQRIIHRHGGRVWAEGELEQGATFFFTLA